MQQGQITLRPSFPFFVGIISVVAFPVWILVVAIDLLGWRPSDAPINYLWVGGVLWLFSILGASPSLLFRLHFLEDRLHFKWFGYTSRVLLYSDILYFQFPAYSYGGLRLHLANRTRDVYWVDLDKVADLLCQHSVPNQKVT